MDKMSALEGVAVLHFTLRKLFEGIDIISTLDNSRQPQFLGLSFLRCISSINLK